MGWPETVSVACFCPARRCLPKTRFGSSFHTSQAAAANAISVTIQNCGSPTGKGAGSVGEAIYDTPAAPRTWYAAPASTYARPHIHAS